MVPSWSAIGLDAIRLAAWLIVLAIVFVPLERVGGSRQQPVIRSGLWTDLAYYFINGVVPKLLLVLPLSVLAALVHQLAPLGLYRGLDELSAGWRFAAALVVGEIGAYWGHRMMHAVPALWRFHAIHHSAEELDWLVNTRAHPLDLVFTRLSGLAPIYLLGLAQPGAETLDWVPFAYALFGSIWGFVIHANLRWRFGRIEWLISTPGFHHWHHARDGAAYVDNNFAAIFPWVDRLFGTMYLPERRWPTRYGSDTPVTSSLIGQLSHPFAPGERRRGATGQSSPSLDS